MNLSRLMFLPLLAALFVATPACGGNGEGVPEGVVAIVDDTAITRKELDEVVERVKKNYEAQNQVFPKVGTPEYQNLQKQYVAVLVQRVAFEQEADERGLEVTEKDLDEEVAKLVESRFDGKRTEFEQALKEQGYTVQTFRDEIRISVLSQRLYDVVTKEVKVSEGEVTSYYDENQASYSRPDSRDVRHILIAEKKKDGSVDYAKSKVKVDQVRAELVNGGDFAALAKEHSDDSSSASDGGRYTAVKGRSVPEFDKKAFELELGVISEPVRTTFGYHIIEALTRVRKAETMPLGTVRASIEATLLREKRSKAMEDWIEDLRDEYDEKTRYARGFEPPEPSDESDTDATTTG